MHFKEMKFTGGMVLLVGPSSAGKTTWLNDHFNPKMDCVISFNTFKEECYTQLFHPKPDWQSSIKRYEEVWNYFDKNKDAFSDYLKGRVDQALDFVLRTHGNLFIDNTNLSVRARSLWVKLAREQNMPIHAVEFWCKLDLLLNRNTTRSDQRIPVLNLRQQFNAQTECLLGIECDSFEVIK